MNLSTLHSLRALRAHGVPGARSGHPLPTLTGGLGPERLLAVAAGRLRDARPDLAARFDLTTLHGLLDARAALAAEEDPAGGVLAVVVVDRFRLPEWVAETCRFALSLPEERAEPWRRAFTRTLFLTGRPGNLTERFAFDHVAEDGSAAWCGPAPGAATTALRRMLKTFSGTRELSAWPPVTVEVPAPGGTVRPPVHRDLYVATARVTVSELLVQVNHLVVEAVLDGLIAPGDRLTLRPVPRLTGTTVPYAALRVDTDPHGPRGLRAYAGLTEES
ncbi:hypothetical protein GCM10017562_61920 [Streptomyces roseofulvus]|uniref:DUF6182 family protein n=2 Tax=Streptomyces TaxID=1883 RepID=A0ABU4K1I9_9ACTN|nr:DUF6182 family protein [Streptomyces roseolus]MDX2291622.1 DUF6182 family protein [Streptomyces roseolus]